MKKGTLHCLYDYIYFLHSYKILSEKVRFRDFEEAGVKGIDECKTRSIIQFYLQIMYCVKQITI